LEHQDFVKLVTEIVRKELSKQKIPRMYPATVHDVSIDNRYATVKIAGFDTEFSFPNKTGETLTIGKNVYVEAINGDLSNAVISYTFG